MPLSKAQLSDIKKLIKEKRERFRKRIRQIIGRYWVDGRYYQHGLGLDNDLRFKGKVKKKSYMRDAK